MARRHGLDRRLYTRIMIPPSDYCYLPKIIFDGTEFLIVDISVGGACVADPEEKLLSFLSQSVELKLWWPDLSESLLLQVAGVSKNVNRHLQFLNLSYFSRLRIEDLVRMGCLGNKMSKAGPVEKTPIQLSVNELWTGPDGDVLQFFENPQIDGELNLGNLIIQFYHRSSPRVISLDGLQSRPISRAEISQVIVFLANIKDKTPRLMRILFKLSRAQDLQYKEGA